MSGQRPEQLVASRFPAVAARLADVEADGSRVAAVRRKARNWERLLERWLEALSLPRFGAVALTGVGDGSPLAALLRALPEGCHVFVYEPDPAALKAALLRPEAADWAGDPRVFLGCGALDEACFEAMAGFPALESLDAVPLIFAPYYFLAGPETFRAFFSGFARELKRWRKLRGTNAFYSGLWQRNTIENLPLLLPAPDVGALERRFAGATMTLVSAGPSLDESLELARRARERSLLVAVNSSYRALLKAGVRPHVVLAADPFETVDAGFEGVSTDGVTLVCPFIVCPQAARRFAGRIFTWSGQNLLVAWLRAALGLPAGSAVAEQGTVSACAADLAAKLGCSQVLLLGQDLCVREDGRSHAVDTFYTERGANRADLASCLWLPGNTLEKVPVEEKLGIYLKVFESLVQALRGRVAFRNASRLGARIQGAPYATLAEAEELLAASATEPLREGLAALERAGPEEAGLRERARAALEGLRQYAREACRTALEGAIAMEGAPASAEGGAEAAFERARAARERLDALFEERSDLHSILADGELKIELLRHARAAAELSPNLPQAERERVELESYLWAAAEGAFQTYAALESALGQGLQPSRA